MRIQFALLLVAVSAFITAASLRADEVVLKNGDKLTGAIGQISDGSMKFHSPVLGDLTLKLADLRSYSTTEPATVRLKNKQSFSSPISQGTSTQITTANNQTTPLTAVKTVNPPTRSLTGAFVLNGVLNRGNSDNATIGASAAFVYRRDTKQIDDRFTWGADYNYADTGIGNNKTTTTDNWDAMFKYDRFLSDQFYAYGDITYAHDRIAALNIRLTPGVGVGYQWFESADFNFYTEGGAAYLYEDYQTSGVDQTTAFRLAYHVDKKLNAKVGVFNDVEFIAAFDDPSNYVINADAGIRADLAKNFFSQFKVVYTRNDHPAIGRLKDDLSFLLGVGWSL